MFIHARAAIAEALRNAGYRVVTPMKVSIGWVDVVVRRMSLAIDFYEGCLESCLERLTSHPFRNVFVVGDGEGCTSIEDVCKNLGVKVPEVTFFDVESGIRHLSTKAVMDGLAYLYIAGEVYENGEYSYRSLRNVLPDLKMYGLAVSSSRPRFKPHFFVSLSRDGYMAAKKIIASRVAKFEKKLRRLSSPTAYLIALGVSNDLRLVETNSPNDFDLKNMLSYMRSLQIDAMTARESHPKVMLGEFLVKTVLNGEAVRIAEELCSMGLAVKQQAYSPYGYEMGEEYRFAPEAIEAILKFSYADVPREIMSEFLAAYYPLLSNDVYPILRYCRKELERAEKAGVCRLYGSKIVLSEKFVDYAKVRLAMVAEKLIEDLSV